MIYRFKIWFDDDEDIVRWIDMKPGHTFLDFHRAILQSIGFEDAQPASFYSSNDRWTKGFEITLMDMGFEEQSEPTLMMDQVRLKHYINDPHQRFIYIHDFIEMWTLHIELQSIMQENKDVTYPNLYKSEGTAPKQNAGAGKFKLLEDTELDDMADDIIREKGGLAKDISISDLLDEAGVDEGFEEDDDEDPDDDEFGPSYGEDLDENELP
jgi:hypothetical protein